MWELLTALAYPSTEQTTPRTEMLTNFKLAASFVYVAVIDSEGLDNKIDIFVLLQLIVEKNSKRSVLAMKT